MPKKEIKNLKKAAERIKKAIESGERIILYGDADLDGITSIIILKETINNLGGKVASIYIPDREKEGYGINEKALEILKDLSPALFISMDLGIGNFREIDLANKMGFEVVVIDHHQPLDSIPNASIVVAPKQKGDSYPFKNFANVGLIYKLAKVLLGDKFSESLDKSFLELTALGTIADMMPEIDENEEIIERGLASLEKTYRPGLRAFFEIPSFRKKYQLEGIRQMAYKIIGALNASKPQNHLHQSYFLLTSSSIEEAKKIAEALWRQNYQRKSRIREITDEVKKRISTKIEDKFFFEGDPFWPLLLLGAVATNICNEYKKPVFLYRKGQKKSKGAVRSPDGLNSVNAMESCSHLFTTYGGHPAASGFTIPNENLEELKKCLEKYCTENGQKQSTPKNNRLY